MSEDESSQPEVVKAAVENIRDDRDKAEATLFRELRDQCVRTQQFQAVVNQYVQETENHLTRLRVLVANNLGGIISGVEAYFIQRGDDSHGGGGGEEEG